MSELFCSSPSLKKKDDDVNLSKFFNHKIKITTGLADQKISITMYKQNLIDEMFSIDMFNMHILDAVCRNFKIDTENCYATPGEEETFLHFHYKEIVYKPTYTYDKNVFPSLELEYGVDINVVCGDPQTYHFILSVKKRKEKEEKEKKEEKEEKEEITNKDKAIKALSEIFKVFFQNKHVFEDKECIDLIKRYIQLFDK